MTKTRKAIPLLAALQLAALVLARPAIAQNRGIDTLFPARPAGYLTDAARVVDPASAAAIESLALRLRDRTGAEIAVVTLPSIGDYAPVDVAVAIGRAWGVGAKADIGDATRNAGIVVLLVPKRADQPRSGKIFIATGQGLEGIVTDAASGRVRDAMLPQLRQEQYGPALLTGTQALAGLIAQGLGVRDSVLGQGPRAASGSPMPTSLVILLAIFVFVFIFLVLSQALRGTGGRRGRRGPYISPPIIWGGGGGGHGWGGGGGGFGGFGGGGGFSGGGAGGDF